MDFSLFNRFRKQNLDERQIDELIGISRGFCADGSICQSEAEYLQKWLIANRHITSNPVVENLLHKINRVLSDGILTSDEATELLETLNTFTGGDIETGEILKSTSLPLDSPAPDIIFAGKSFCFTGTFGFGTRGECESFIGSKGGQSHPRITKKLNYLVIGAYATDAWIHSSYGRKIEKALSYRDEGAPIAIVSEEHWIKFF
jgi:NAD-dependent DNA ligase